MSRTEAPPTATDNPGQFTPGDQELELVEDEQDPYTHAVIKSFDLPAHPRCLELGAGNGSMARWMHSQLDGSVIAVDRDLTAAALTPDDSLTLIEADIGDIDFDPHSFDLIHARAILTHLPSRAQLLGRMVSWLAPGGYLLVTDPADFPVASSPHPVVRRMAEVLVAASESMGTDTAWARRYPAQLLEHGLSEVDAECRLRMMRGGNREALMLAGLYRQARPLLLAHGCTEHDVDQVLDLLADPRYVDLPPAVIRAWGRQPA